MSITLDIGVDRPRDHATFDVGEGHLIYWRAEITENIWKTKIPLIDPTDFAVR